MFKLCPPCNAKPENDAFRPCEKCAELFSATRDALRMMADPVYEAEVMSTLEALRAENERLKKVLGF